MTEFTEQQKEAINLKNQDILVSASAGSGKTSVLVERVLREILAGTSVDELLVVTFTKSAANEMKKRIKQTLTEQLNKFPVKRRYLQEQLNLIDTANISTIDAFCLDVIYRFYYVIDVDPSFSILTDETQAALLKERALREIENEFLTKTDNDFLDFYDNFSGDRDADGPEELLLDLYDYALAKPNYKDWLNNLAKEYDVGNDLVSSKLWQTRIKPYLGQKLRQLKEKVDQILTSPQIDCAGLEKVKTDFTVFGKALKNCTQSLDNDLDFDKQRETLINCKFTQKYRKSSKWDEDIIDFYEETQTTKKQLKDEIQELFYSFYVDTQDEQRKIMAKSKKITQTISKVELALITRFNELKREENLLDYSDMEQLAYQILSQDTSNSQLARNFYQNKFSEILIDEYQDINTLQEKIIQLLKGETNNLFMVGDVKQSIYGFRQAAPDLFLKKYHDFAKEDKQKRRILLADNFRSTWPVLKSVNKIFSNLLTKDFGGIDYKNEGKLLFGAKYYPETIPQATEFIYHKKITARKSQDSLSQNNFNEIKMVIRRIKQMEKENFQVYDASTGHKRKFCYSDIAILTRSRSDDLTIMQEFVSHNLPLFVTDAQNYFQTFELTIIMNYLKLIDNPDQDIPLVTVLRSPLFNFREKELAKIRIKSKSGSFFDALTAYISTGNELSQKIGDFLNQLHGLRKFAQNHRISELIWSIYEQTSLLEIMTAMPNGEQRRINLQALYERANSYESAGFKGLYQFINFIKRIQKSQKDLAQPLLTKESGNAVRLMTIHGAKGLEFPIVFYIGLGHKFQLRDVNHDYLISEDSIGLTVKQEHYRADSLLKAIGNVQKRQQMLEEEARIMYVGLTRAKQKLILVADIANFDKKIAEWSRKDDFSLMDKLSATSPFDFIGPVLQVSEQINYKIGEIPGITKNQDFIYVVYDQENEESPLTSKKETLQDGLVAKLEPLTEKLYKYTYPHQDASRTAAYQSVSELKRAFNDPVLVELENSQIVKSSNRYLQPINTRPDFLFANKFTGAEIGTATHLILQYYDYRGSGSAAQLSEEIHALCVQHKLNPEIVPSIKKEQIDWFVHSDFAQKFWQEPDKLKREVDFSSLLPAQKLFKNFSDPQAKILLHGTIDGYFITNRGIILFDYKTDYIPKKDRHQAIEKIKQKYTGQLNLYSQALEQFSGQKVLGKYLVLLAAKSIVAIN